ncbi:hypothetical protein [Winogradskyella bathintestinalis]|uniref:Lipoprotein n=1 Tax=Winogradskyella bathintestinalis TaxID=3035208 RepID=A0ABT7ZRT3_9FLAO|nr:hypothetical protein [Winogradskyella bathintestinalis]MDN3491719.1 hypothetical protein [Winogradskyella bathintestinalis]
MKITSVLLGVCCVIFMSCGEEKNNTVETETKDATEQSARISAKTIENIEYNDYALSPEGENAVVTWEKHQELATQISYLKRGDFSFFNGDKEQLKKFIEEFKSQLPEGLKTNPVVSRNAIVETTLLKLNENLTLDNIERTAQLVSIKEMFVAFSNLNYQINKKLERDMYDKIQPE